MSKVVVIGQGYVGLPMSLQAAEAGHSVVGLDVNENVVEQLNRGISHIDDVTRDALQRGLDLGYRATVDPEVIAQADVVVVCVPTPLSGDGGPDLGAVEATGRVIGRFLNGGSLCILESTTYPGTTEEVFMPLVAGRKFTVGEDIFVAFSPERIDPGNREFKVKNTPKVVGGITDICTTRAREFYSTFIDTVVPAKGAKEAEMAKLLENTFRHVNIALVNEMVRFCQELDIDLWDAIDAASTKPFGYMPFRPGPGVGGHCIPVDPSYLSHRVKAKLGYAFRMVELAEEINHAAPGYVCERARDLLNDRSQPVRGSKVLLVGVSYKADISDVRESPAIQIASILNGWGAEVAYHDPYVENWTPDMRGTGRVRRLVSLDGGLTDFDLVIFLQDHSTIDRFDLVARSRMILDTRAALPCDPKVTRL